MTQDRFISKDRPTLIRSIAAIVAGLVVTVLLVVVVTILATAITGVGPAGPPTTSYLVANLVGSALAGMAGGAAAALIAPRAAHGHVIALAVVILIMSIPSALATPAPGQPSWYPLTLSFLGPAAVWLGGFLIWRRSGPPVTGP